MARWPALDSFAIGLLAFVLSLAVAGARPMLVQNRPCPPSAAPFRRVTARAYHVNVGLRDGDNNDHGGFTVASIVGISVSTAFAIFVVMSTCYWVYYKHAKLKLRREYLERLESLEEAMGPREGGDAIDLGAASHASPAGRPPPRAKARTGVAVQHYGFAALMSSSAQLSPAVYSALQTGAGEPKSPASAGDPKMRAAVLEDKVLGCSRDFRSTGHGFEAAVVDGQPPTMPRRAL